MSLENLQYFQSGHLIVICLLRIFHQAKSKPFVDFLRLSTLMYTSTLLSWPGRLAAMSNTKCDYVMAHQS